MLGQPRLTRTLVQGHRAVSGKAGVRTSARLLLAGGSRRERKGVGKGCAMQSLAGPGPGMSSLHDGIETGPIRRGGGGGTLAGRPEAGLICG